MIHVLSEDHKEHLRTLGVVHVPDELDIPDGEYDEHLAAWMRTLPDAAPELLHTKVIGHHASKLHSRVHDRIPPAHIAKKHEIEDAKNKEIMAVRGDVNKLVQITLPQFLTASIHGAQSVAASITSGTENIAQSIIEASLERDKQAYVEHRDSVRIAKVLYWLAGLLGLLIVATIFAPRAHGQFSKINTIQLKQSGSAVTGGFMSYPFSINCSANLTCTVSGSVWTIDLGATIPSANLPAATTSAKGAVIPRDGLAVDGSGNLDFNAGDPTIAYIYDEFMSGNATSGSIGSTGWNVSTIAAACTMSNQNGVYPNLGIFRVTSNAAASSSCQFVANIAVSAGSNVPALGDLTTNTNWELNIIFKLVTGSPTNYRFRVGLFNASPAVTPTDGAYLRFDQNAGFGDTVFKLCGRTASGTETCSATTQAVDTSFHRLKIRSTTAGTWLISLWSSAGASQIAEQTIVSAGNINITPTTVNMQMGAICGNDVTASTVSCDFDFASFKIRGLPR